MIISFQGLGNGYLAHGNQLIGISDAIDCTGNIPSSCFIIHVICIRTTLHNYTYFLRVILCKHLNFFGTHRNRFCRNFSKMQTLLNYLKITCQIIYILTSFHGNSTQTSIFIKIDHFYCSVIKNAASSTFHKHRIKIIKPSTI